MKVRSDFVSNSSSSSFVVCGKIVEGKDNLVGTILNSVLKQKSQEEIFKLCDMNPEEYHNDIHELIDYMGIEWFIEDVLSQLSLVLYVEGEGDGENVLFGISPDKMRDDQTLKEFKEQVANSMSKVGVETKPEEVKFISGGSDSSGYTFFESNG